MSDIVDKREKTWIEYIGANKELFIKVIKVLSPEYFSKPLDRPMKFILEYFNEYHNLPPFSVLVAESGVELEAKKVESKSDLLYLVDAIEQHCRHADMRLAILEAVELLEDDNFGAIEERVRKPLMMSVDDDLGLDVFDNPRLVLEQMMMSIDACPIGIQQLDELLDNAKRGELGLFAANSGGGKSVMLANVAKYMCEQKKNTLYLTFELKDALVAKRVYSMLTGIAGKDVFDNIDDISDFIIEEKENYGKFHIKKMPVGTCASDIRAYLLEYHLKYGFFPDVICVDYLDILKPNDHRLTDLTERDKAKSEELRDLFEEFNAYGFTASQLNRDSIDATTKSQAHIAGSLAKINTADWVITLIRTEENIDNGTLICQAIKLRNAEMTAKPITLYWNGDTLEITNDPQKGNIKKHVARQNQNRFSKPKPPPVSAKKSDVDKINDITNMTGKIMK